MYATSTTTTIPLIQRHTVIAASDANAIHAATVAARYRFDI